MSRLSLQRATILSSVTVVLIAAACSSDDSNKNSSDNNASNVTNGTTATSSNTAAGPTTNGTSAGTQGTANNTVGPTNGTTGSTNGSTTTGAGGGPNSTTDGSSGGTSSVETSATNTTEGTTGGGGTGGGGTNPIAGTDNYDCSAPEGDVPALTLTEVVGGLEAPVEIEHPPNDDRLFVLELSGDVRIIKDGTLVSAPFLSLGNKVSYGGALGDERGLLGIAFHPEYAENGLFYLHYSSSQGSGDTVIEEYQVSDDPDVADAASARTVLTVVQPNNGGTLFNHKGGSINFGSDGFMYIGLGDGGGSGDTNGNAQNTTRLLGKILRINPLESGGEPYTTPADNLVQDVAGAAPEIWDYGLRNPFRRTFDACTGDMYIGDVGQNEWEEITIEKAGDGHKNYGWNVMEALHCYGAQTCNDDGMTPPLIEVGGNTASSITGGSVYRGSSIPALRGAYFYVDYVSNNAWYTRYNRDAGTVEEPTSVTQDLNVNNIVAIKNGNDGELYFVAVVASGEISASLGQGAIYKLAAAE